tara:strand:- start:11327 stop:12154 length:828 start_codon:yes stop_codon:yes gene_type:complete
VSVAPGGFGVPVLTSGTDYSGAFNSGSSGGGGFNLGSILQGGITAGLDSLLGGLFGGGSSGGSSGSGPFSEGLGDLIQAGPAAYFDNELVERATQRVNAETLKNLNQLRNNLFNIAYLTGQSTPEFVNRTEGRFQNYLEPAAQRGYNFLNTYPAKYGQTLAGDSLLQRFQIDNYLESYSNLNRPTYMNQATNPTTVSMKMNEMEDVANTYMNKFKEASNAGGLMNYMDQQSQSFIQGAGAPDLPDVPDVPEYRQKASKFYSKDRGVQDLMTYSSY